MTTLTPSEGEALQFYQWPLRYADKEESLWQEIEIFESSQSKNFDVSFSSVLANAEQLSLFVDIDPEVLRGTPRITGTRIPIYMVLNAIYEHGSIQGATKAYRSLTIEQVQDALQFAIHVLEFPLEHESSSTDR